FSFAARALGDSNMAKKGRTAKRSTKAGKRRPTTKRVAAKSKGGAFQSGAFQSGAFQGLPPSASQRKLSAAVQSTQGVVIEPPPAALNLSATPPEVRIQPVSVQVDGIVMPSPLPITPTVYPDSPQGTIIVQNHVTINIQSEEFSRFNKNIEA